MEADEVGLALRWSEDLSTECELYLPVSFNAAMLLDRQREPYKERERGKLTQSFQPEARVTNGHHGHQYSACCETFEARSPEENGTGLNSIARGRSKLRGWKEEVPGAGYMQLPRN